MAEPAHPDAGANNATQAGQPGTDRTLCLVGGYHAASFPPADVYASGFRHRFAVVMGTYRRDKGAMYFDVELFLGLVPELCRAVGADSVTIRMGGGAEFPSFADLARHYAGRDELERDPPERIELSHGGRRVGVVQSEGWTAVGGPTPYHDSVTLSFYTDRDHSAELRRVAEAACAGLGAVITGNYPGVPSKGPQRSWRRRLLHWFDIGAML